MTISKKQAVTEENSLRGEHPTDAGGTQVASLWRAVVPPTKYKETK